MRGYDPLVMDRSILIKSMLSKLFNSIGIHSLLERICFSDKAFVLMYHRVLDSAEDQPCYVQPGMFVTTATFQSQIEFLRDRFKIIFFDDLVQKALGGEDIGGFCSLTFDDGWQDNYTNAFPVLKRCQVPATIFLATGFVGTDRIFWPEELSYYLDRGISSDTAVNGAPASFARFMEEIGRHHSTEREVFLDSGIETLKLFSSVERNEVLEYLRGMHCTAPIPRQMLSWNEAREMLESGWVRFGAHSVNHEILDRVSPQKAKDEVYVSSEEIESRLGSRVGVFAYPNGNHNESIRKLLVERGFDAAVTTRKGFLGRDTPLMEIPRIAIHEDVSGNVPMFRSRILFNKF
jgi:peptidoglycan/xylan/chitin deacetylase (PgdA/CDA1 family)